MTILLVTDQFPPKHFGGMAQHAWHLSRYLAEGHRTIVAVPRCFGTSRVSGGPDVRPVLTMSSLGRDASALLNLARTERCDVIHACTAGMAPLALSAEFPIVQRVVGNDFLRPWCGGNLPLRSIFYRIPVASIRNAFATREMQHRKAAVLTQLAQCRTVIANSQWTATALRNAGLPDDKIRVIVGGMDCSTFLPASERSGLRASLGVDSEDFMIVTVGNFVPKKGFDTVLRALARLRDRAGSIRYFAIGDGPEEARLRNLVAELGISHLVTFTGRMNQEKLTSYYQACDAYVQASSEETMGRTYMEAGGCGAPVVAARTGGVPEVVRHRENGLLIDNPADPSELADTISLLLSDPTLRASLGAAGIRRAREEFSWDIVAEKFERQLVDATEAKADA